MLGNDIRRAEGFLGTFVGSALICSERSKYQLRLTFEKKLEFVISSPWRLMLKGAVLGGSGDEGGANVKKALDSLKGLHVVSVAISPSWDTKLSLERNYAIEVIADSVLYETWEAHVEAGWIVFVGGEITLFPPAASVEGSAHDGR